MPPSRTVAPYSPPRTLIGARDGRSAQAAPTAFHTGYEPARSRGERVVLDARPQQAVRVPADLVVAGEHTAGLAVTREEEDVRRTALHDACPHRAPAGGDQAVGPGLE